MGTLLTVSLKVALVNFSANAVIAIVIYILKENEIKIEGLSLFLGILSIIFFIISLRQIANLHLDSIGEAIITTSFSVLLNNILIYSFVLFLHGYIDPTLRYEIAHASVTHLYETIQQMEQENNVTMSFDYDEEVNKIAKSFEPVALFQSGLMSVLISLVLYNFLILLTNRSQMD